jgi:hypothetical protein
MINLTVTQYRLRNPTWSKNPANAGETVTLSVEAPYITGEQWIEFRISLGAELLAVVQSKPGKTTAPWKALNLKRAANLTHQLSFKALLREKPAAANGFVGIFESIDCPTQLTLHGYHVNLTGGDDFFVPKQEQLNAAYTITNPGNAALKGRYEIWAERYPGTVPAPAYTKSFDPAVGAQTWTEWDGKANHGTLKGAYLTPEFSPYRLRVLIGPDSASVEDPYGKGLGLVAADERTFEVRVNAILIRIVENIKEAAKKDEYKLESALGVEPRAQDGEFEDEGRLPNGPICDPNDTADEVARIRVPITIFSAIADDLGQGGDNVGDGYGDIKWDRDYGYYTRPELPIEFEPRLKSRDNNVNTDLAQRGLFEPAAIGPLLLEPFCEDDYSAGNFGGTRGAYWRNAALKVKRGAPHAPFHTAANAPAFLYWQARFVAVLNQQDFDVSTVDATFGYTFGQQELKVYLNGALLQRSDRNDDNELTAETHDYREVNANPAIVVRLRQNTAQAGDIVWVVRVPKPSPGGTDDVDGWDRFPPGINCHIHYGGVRGDEPDADHVNYFRKKYSANPAKPRQPIIGKLSGSEFPYNTHVNLRPHLAVDVDKQERVEISVLDSGKRKGLAGVLFSPSYVGGDAYKLHALVEEECYVRSFGFVENKARIDDWTGRLTVWRVATIKKSFRLPDVGSNNMAPGVGSLAELAVGVAVPGVGYPAGTTQRLYRGDGLNMSFTAANGIGTFMADSFCEWVVPEEPAQVHQDVNLKTYRKTVNKLMKGNPGRFKMNSNADVKNWLAVLDPYRNQLPPGVPATRLNLIANTIAGEAAGSDGQTIATAVRQAIINHVGVADAPLDPGVSPIGVYAGSAAQYSSWVEDQWDNIAHTVMAKFLGSDDHPKYMNVLRWPYLHENYTLWIGYNAATNTPQYETSRTNGECYGNGQSYFLNAEVTETFSHEMGHSLHLAHFVAGDFNWKHHNVSTPECLMSYDYKTAKLRKPGGAVGPNGGTPETGWPHVKSGQRCIFFKKMTTAPVVARSSPCAKCALKVRGWKEDVLPFAWNHPDLF